MHSPLTHSSHSSSPHSPLSQPPHHSFRNPLNLVTSNPTPSRSPSPTWNQLNPRASESSERIMNPLPDRINLNPQNVSVSSHSHSGAPPLSQSSPSPITHHSSAAAAHFPSSHRASSDPGPLFSSYHQFTSQDSGPSSPDQNVNNNNNNSNTNNLNVSITPTGSNPRKRKPATSRTRHNLAEQKRRQQMREAFEKLKGAIPAGHRRASKVSVLNEAHDYIYRLIEENSRLKQENDRLGSELQKISGGGGGISVNLGSLGGGDRLRTSGIGFSATTTTNDEDKRRQVVGGGGGGEGGPIRTTTTKPPEDEDLDDEEEDDDEEDESDERDEGNTKRPKYHKDFDD